MKVLLVHNYYQQRGGEDAAFERDAALLRKRGHEVALHTVRSDSVTTTMARLAVLHRMTFSRPAYDAIRKQIASFRPNIMHVSNFFPVLTPAVHVAARDCGVPTAQCLRNYRLLCPGGLLWRADDGVEPRVRQGPLRCVLRGCYRGSRVATFAVRRMLAHHRHAGTWSTVVDHFIAPSDFVRNRHVEAGMPPQRISVRTDFAPVPIQSSNVEARTGALFVGRLTREKGLLTLLSAWRSLSNVPLTIVGAGPLEVRARATARTNITFLGTQPQERVARLMRDAEFLIMPSEWYEAEPLVIMEAFAAGLPVIASRLGAMAEMVTHGVDGLHFRPGDGEDLAAQVRWATEHPDEMQRMRGEAQSTHARRFSEDVSYSSLMRIYETLCSGNG